MQYNCVVKYRSTPTEQAYTEFQTAYDWFNKELFKNELPACLITFQRNKRTYGYFSPNRFVNQDNGKTDEIALNPEYFAIQTIEQVLSTLVHEMAHLWQQHHGKPGRGKYHNQEWADKMLALGLPPSHTGKPGGRQTGDQMDHYLLDSGPFLKKCKELLHTSFRISWYDFYPAGKTLTTSGVFDSGGIALASAEAALHESIPALASPNMLASVAINGASNRVKFKCAGCGAQAWGKGTLNLICADCSLAMPAT